MSFSRLGPATATHSAYRRAGILSAPRPNLRAPGTDYWSPKAAPAPPSLGFSTQRLLSPSPSAPTLPSYLEKLAVIWMLRVGLPEETQPVLPGDELSPWAWGCIWMYPLTWG